MGWKNVKDHYRIEHIVQVTEKGICIGSPYIHDIIVIGMDGKLCRRYEDGANKNLLRYQSEMEADLAKLQDLIAKPDTFEKSVTVYTYDDGIIEKQCEEPGWPNVTYDGRLMYENTFSVDKDQVIAWAKRSADLAINAYSTDIQRLEKDLADRRAELEHHRSYREGLERLYPGVKAEE